MLIGYSRQRVEELDLYKFYVKSKFLKNGYSYLAHAMQFFTPFFSHHSFTPSVTQKVLLGLHL